MESDFLSVIVPFTELQRDIYAYIITSAGLGNPIECLVEREKEDRENIARNIADIVGNKKSVVIGFRHYNVAFCYNNQDTTLIVFDAHNDSYRVGEAPYFNDGNFLLKRKGNVHIAGSYVPSDHQTITVYKPKEISRILDVNILGDIVLSLDIDVFNKSVTTAHYYTHRLGHKERHLSFEQVLELSLELIHNRNLLGINIAGYEPAKENQPYKTAQLLADYLSCLLKSCVDPCKLSQAISH